MKYFDQLKPYVDQHTIENQGDFLVVDKYTLQKCKIDKPFIFVVRENGTNLLFKGDNLNLLESLTKYVKAVFYCCNGDIKKITLFEAFDFLKDN